MSNPKPATKGSDWTRLLADPDLLANLGELLQTYRDAPPETREEALLEVMRRIKSRAPKTVVKAAAAGAETSPRQTSADAPATTPQAPPAASATPAPPFEPDMFTPSFGQDRRRYPRIKCFVVVELRVNGSPTPVWGNLSNTSLGGCLVETPITVDAGAKIEIGLWVTSGQVWVKGLVLNGIVTRANPSFGVRVKFADMEPAERETLKQFLKFVETTTKGYAVDHGYLAQLKR
jgi:PilZ domain